MKMKILIGLLLLIFPLGLSGQLEAPYGVNSAKFRNYNVSINDDGSNQIIYVSKSEGSNVSGDGSEENPYASFQHAVASISGYIEGIYQYIIKLDTGTYYSSEIIPYLNFPRNQRITVAGTAVIEDTINVNHVSSYFRWSTDSTLVGDLSGKYIETLYGAAKDINFGMPILSNTDSTIIGSWLSSGISGEKRIISWGTKLVADMGPNHEYWNDLNHLELRNIEIQTDNELHMFNMSFVEFFNVSFVATSKVYDLLDIQYSNSVTIRSCYFSFDGSSAGGDALELRGLNVWIWGNVFKNEDTGTRAGAIEIRPSALVECVQNAFEGWGHGIKNEASEVHISGIYSNDLTKGILYFEEVSYAAFYDAEDRFQDSIIGENTAYFIDEGTSPNSGRTVVLHYADVGGHDAFSDLYQNYTQNLDTLYTISVGGGTLYQTIPLVSGSLTDGAPTDAEIDAIIGFTPSAVGAGRYYIIEDSDGSGLLYLVWSNGTNWFYLALSQAT